MRTMSSVSLCVAVVTALHVAAPAEESLKGLWVPHSDSVKPTDVLTFHVYWTLNDDRASSSRCHEKGAAGSQAVLDCKVHALAPIDSAVAATKAWLEPAREYCSYTWNTVHCRDVPVGVTESLFGMATGSITSWCKRTACNTAGAPQAHRYLAAGSASATVPRECQVDSISGVHLHDYVRKSARHTGQVRADSRITAAKAPSLEPNARTPQLPPPYTGYVPQPEGDFGATTLFFGLPFVLGADEWFVTVIPACQFGSSLIYSNVTAFSQWCGASFDTPPSSFTVTYTDLNSGVVQYTSRQYYPSELYNTSAARLLTTGADQTNYAVFFIPAAPSSTFFSWQQLNINVTAFYAPGTSSASTQTNSMSAFWDGETYTAGFNESPTDNGWTAATMPLAAVTMPSPTYNEPSDLRSAYGVPVGATASGQVAGVVEFTDVAYPQGGLSATDVQYFLSNISVTGTYSIIGNASIVSAGETTLDIELMLGVATGVKAYVYCLEYGGRQYNQYSDAMEAFASTAFAQQDTTGLFKFGPSTVWSISYGGPEWIDTQTNIPDPQLLRVNTLFKHLTDAGITVVASSGDSGSVWLGEFSAKLVNFPASSPYVVGVGATARRLNGGEMACSAQEGNVITSGGGYSSAFVPEAWQAMSLPAANRTRAGVPDVAANGAFIYTVLGGTTTALFGTSASSPIIASFIAIINNQMIAKNASHGTLRQATYFLYNRTTVNGGQSNANFNDITDGNNCAGNHGASLSNNYAIYGPNDCYSAGVGWDPVTGLGTPQVSAWIAASYDWTPPSFDSAPDDSDSDSWIHIGIGAGVVVGIVFGVLFVCAIRRQRKQAQNRGQHRSGSSQPGAQSVAFSAVGTPVSGGDTPQPTGAYSAMKTPTAAESV